MCFSFAALLIPGTTIWERGESVLGSLLLHSTTTKQSITST